MAAKRLNKNVVISLTLFVFVMAVVTAALMFRQVKLRDPQYFVDLARTYAQDGQWQTAGLFYRKAWERSGDATHLVDYGDALLADGDVRRALASFREAFINQPDLAAAHTRFLEVLLDQAKLYGSSEDWRRVREAAEDFLASASDLSDERLAFVHSALGLALIGGAQRGADPSGLEQGEAALRQAVTLAPDSSQYAVDLAGHLIRQDRREEAKRLFGDLLERFASPGWDAARARVAYAETLAVTGQIDDAQRMLEKAVALAGDDPEALRDAQLGYAAFLSQRWLRARQTDPAGSDAEHFFAQAEDLLRTIIDSHPDDYQPYLALARLYGSARRHAEIEAVARERLDRGLVRKGIEAARNRVYTFQLYILACEASVAKASLAHNAGDLETRDEWLEKAEAYLEGARGESPSHPRVLTQAGRIKLARGQSREALRDLRAADDAYRGYNTVDWENKFTLARVHLSLNEPGAARELLEAVIERARRERPTDTTFWVLYAQSLVETGETDRALTIADQILSARPQHADALRIKAAVYERQGRIEEAGRIAATLTADPVVQTILSAQERAFAGDRAGALSLIQEALLEHPSDPRLVRYAIRDLFSLDRADEARAVAANAVEADPDNVQLRALAVLTRQDRSEEERDRAMLDIIESQTDAYERAVELAGFSWRKNDLSQTLNRLNTALSHLSEKDTPAAKQAAPVQHRALLTAKLAVAAALDDEQAMSEARTAAAQHNVDGVGGRMIAGLYHLHRQEYDAAIAALRDVVNAYPTDVQAITRLGQAMQIVGRGEEAGDLFERAVRINPAAGEAHKGLAMLAEARGDTVAYKKALQACERYLPNDPWVQAELLEQQEAADPAAAIERREQQLKESPDDAENLKRLALLAETLGDFDRADGYYQRLLDLDPDDRSRVLGAAHYYRRTDRPDRALDVARRYADSRSTVEERANAQIVLASHHVQIGDPERAESVLLAAADLAETFEVVNSLAEFYLQMVHRPVKALPWLEKAVAAARALGDKDPGSTRLARAMAARISCLLRREVNDVTAARRELDEFLAAFPGEPQGKLLESEYFARTGRIEAAVDALAAYLRSRPDDAAARFQRALHYLALGQAAPAVGDLEILKRAIPLGLDLQPRLLLARLHRDAGRKEQWLRELEQLAADAPDDLRAIEALVNAYLSENRLADAERILTARINRAIAAGPTAADARWYFRRGDLALQEGNSSGAIADYQRGAQAAGYSAQSVVKVMGLFLKIDRAADADAFYRRHADQHAESSALLARHGAVLAAMGRKSDAVGQFRRAMHIAGERFSEDRPTEETEAPDASGERAEVGRAVVLPGAAIVTDLYAAFDIDEAIRLLEDAPDDDRLARANDELLIYLYQRAGRFEEATARSEELVRAAANDRERAARLRQLGDLHQLAKKPQEARRAYEEALRYAPRDWITLNNLAFLLSDQLGEFEAARLPAEQAVRFAPNADTHDTLGWVYVGLGKYGAAIAELNRAVQINPEEPLAYFHLGEAYRRSGRMRDAADVLSTGRALAAGRGDADLLARFDAVQEKVTAGDAEP